MSGQEIGVLDFALADVEAFAVDHMRKRGFCSGLLVAWMPDRERFVIGTDWSNKDVFAEVLRALFRAKNVTCYASMSETWMILSRDGRPVDISVPPSQHPQRIEALVCAAFAKGGASRFKVWRILRKPDNRFRALEPLEMPPGINGIGGRFAELLD